VLFGAVEARSFQVVSDSSITATAPAQVAGTVDVTVVTTSGTSALSSADHFTYVATLPQITGVTPATGSTAGGYSVTITGSAFTGASAVSFGGYPATSFTVASDTSIVAVVPAHAAGTVDIAVTTLSGTSAVVSADHLTYTAGPLPVVVGISSGTPPITGYTLVTIEGSNFTGATAVSFGGTPAVFVSVYGDNIILALAPPHLAGTVDVTVTNYAGTSATSSADVVTYTAVAAPSVTSISPTSGNIAGGTSVTITGANLTSPAAVFFGTAVVGSFSGNSDTSVTATAPANNAGSVDITVTSAAGTSGTGTGDQFLYTTGFGPGSGGGGRGGRLIARRGPPGGKHRGAAPGGGPAHTARSVSIAGPRIFGREISERGDGGQSQLLGAATPGRLEMVLSGAPSPPGPPLAAESRDAALVASMSQWTRVGRRATDTVFRSWPRQGVFNGRGIAGPLGASILADPGALVDVLVESLAERA
jgi:hypothetical protein